MEDKELFKKKHDLSEEDYQNYIKDMEYMNYREEMHKGKACPENIADKFYSFGIKYERQRIEKLIKERIKGLSEIKENEGWCYTCAKIFNDDIDFSHRTSEGHYTEFCKYPSSFDCDVEILKELLKEISHNKDYTNKEAKE